MSLFATYERSENLRDLRDTLTNQIAWLLIFGAGFLIWVHLPQRVYPYRLGLVLAGLLALGVVVAKHHARAPYWMRLLLIAGLNAAMLGVMALFAESWVPFLSILIVFAAAALLSIGGFISAGLALAMAMWLTHTGQRDYALLPLAGILSAAVILAWLTISTLFKALDWIKTLHEQVRQLLDETRSRRAELIQTVQQLEQANSALQRMQNDLIYARQEAERAKAMQQQFVANISHELRTPLNLILGFSEIMYQSPAVYGEVVWSPRLRQDVSKIYRSSRHLLGLIDDILDLAYFEAVGYVLNLEATPMTPFLRDAIEIARDLFHSKEVTLITHIPSDLPSLEMDRTRIRQVILNLLNNAQRYTSQGSVTFSAEIDANRKLRMSVSDTGQGIPAENLALIFEEFHQVDPSFRRQNAGAGLGLTISQKFVEAHGGHIQVESKIGSGSTFTFSLPLTADKPISYGEPHIEVSPHHIRPCVVLVSENPAALAMLQRHISEIEFILLASAQFVMQALIQHHPRAILIDTADPQMIDHLGDGISVPVITFSFPRKMIPCEYPVITKPIAAQEIVEMIETTPDVQRILILDEDINTIHLIERIIQTTAKSIRVHRALNSAAGIEQIQAQQPDLILCGLSNPQEIGELASLRRIPVILISASSYVDAIAEYGGAPITIRRKDGLYVVESIRYLRSLIEHIGL